MSVKYTLTEDEKIAENIELIKELIINTPITVSCFERPSFNYDDFFEETLMNEDLIQSELWVWNHELIPHLERLRKEYIEYKDERVFEMLIRILPNSYNIVTVKELEKLKNEI